MVKEFEYMGKAMGTEYSLVLVCGSRELADKIYEIVKKDIIEYESRFSRFIPESELSQLNHQKNMFVSEVFFDVTTKAYQLYIETKGIFNPLVSISRLGYDINFKDIKNSKYEENTALYNVDFSLVIMEQETRRIILKEGQNLDYGGFLKGYLAEIIAKKVIQSSRDIVGVIVNIGGDIHTEGLDEKGNKFAFNIYNPVEEGKDIPVTLYNQSLATSGTYKRFWLRYGKNTHHILDSKGMKNPASKVISASVICDRGAHSEAYAKVFLSMNYKEALKLLGNKNIFFVIIKKNKQIIKNIL